MNYLKKLGVVTLSSILSYGIVMPAVSASTQEEEHEEKAKIRVMSTESVVTKDDLIEKFQEFFPSKFDSLNLADSDFRMNSGHYYPEDDTIRYGLNFHKKINGEQVNGNVGFLGEDLEINNFHYNPVNKADALFPAKLTKDEAKDVALNFITRLSGSSEYQLDTDRSYSHGNQTLTEPIRYSFSFLRLENQVPVSDQRTQVNVLGNGEVIGFSRNIRSNESPSYDSVTEVQTEDEMEAKIKENLSIDLQYQMTRNHQTGDQNVKLVYQPTSEVYGVHAISGEWYTSNGFTSDLPDEKDIDMITDEPIKPKETSFSLEDAKAFAKELLTVDSDKVELSIESVNERENHTGQQVINIRYMYQYSNGGRGTSLELDKATGEIVQYHDIKNEVLKQIGEDVNSKETLSSDVALAKAIEYLKEFAPSYLHNYAKPLEDTVRESKREGYHFKFPRMVDGIPVSGDQLSVRVSTDGSLRSLNVRHQPVDDWPSSKDIISEKEAKEKFIKWLDLDLSYVNENNDEDANHYNLVYTSIFNENPTSFLDADTGNWNSRVDNEGDHQVVTHPWAEDELNYLMSAGILEVEDVDTFDADASLTKGDAIEVIMKSLTRFYDEYYRGQQNTNQSFENINSDHPLYQVVERAVTMGVLDPESATFNLEDKLTREELSSWYIRAIGLEKAAQNSKIYQVDFADANNIQAQYTGHVALAHALGLLTAHNNHFNPTDEVSFAQLALSSVRLGHEVYENDSHRYY